MNDWNDFNNADDSNPFAPIPKGALVKVRMSIKPGGYDDPSQGWTGGWATRNDATGAIYLNGEFVVLEGEYMRRKLWTLIGLHSAKGPTWAQMGRSFIKALLNSAFGLHPDDASAAAQASRRITGLGDLDGIVFVGQVDWEKDALGQDKAVVRTPIAADHPQYAAVMGLVRMPNGAGTSAPPPAAAAARTAHAAPLAARPAWAQ